MKTDEKNKNIISDILDITFDIQKREKTVKKK